MRQYERDTTLAPGARKDAPKYARFLLRNSFRSLSINSSFSPSWNWIRLELKQIAILAAVHVSISERM